MSMFDLKKLLLFSLPELRKRNHFFDFTLDQSLLFRDDLCRDLDFSVLTPDLILELLDDLVGLEEFLRDTLGRVLPT